MLYTIPGSVTALAWSPTGQLLAAASRDAPGFTVFDVSMGLGTPVQAGAQAWPHLPHVYPFPGHSPGPGHLGASLVGLAALNLPVRVLHAGLGIVTGMWWSPDGAYLLTAGGAQESFRLWETQKWTSQAWSTAVRGVPCFLPTVPSSGLLDTFPGTCNSSAMDESCCMEG